MRTASHATRGYTPSSDMQVSASGVCFGRGIRVDADGEQGRRRLGMGALRAAYSCGVARRTHAASVLCLVRLPAQEVKSCVFRRRIMNTLRAHIV